MSMHNFGCRSLAAIGLLTTALAWVGPASAGPVFLTGHDPDFHAQDSVGAQNLLRTGLSFVTGGTFDDGPTTKFLWVESRIAPPSGHRIGELGLGTIGLALGTNYDRANAAEFLSANLSGYTAIVIASSFGGLLSQAELDALFTRKTDIKNFINAGKGLFAMSECAPAGSGCQADLITDPTKLFAYLPVVVSSVNASAPFTVTAFGASLGLTNGDVNDATHNSFGITGGLNIVDTGSTGVPTTLAGNVLITDGGFITVPTVPLPGSLALLGIGLAGLAFAQRRTRRA